MASISSLLLSLILSCLVRDVVASYVLDTAMFGSSFFNNFNFQASPDLSNGFVQYVGQSAAQAAGLIFAQNGGRVRIAADSKSVVSGNAAGRKSIRIQSKKSWTHGLFIHDMAALPVQACGIWPTLWLLGPNWPSNGEIDIVEGVNSGSTNVMSCHTGPDCTFPLQSSTSSGANSHQCDGTLNFNAGCGYTAFSTSTYGSGFNAAAGGVYATQWTSSAIKIWHFSRSSIPRDITLGKPNPSGWGAPLALFKGGSNCVIDKKFASMSLVLSIDFCGDWAGNVWSTDASCRSKAVDCKTYVAKNPAAFTGSQFLVNSIKVYTDPSAKKRSDLSSSSSSSSSSPSSPSPPSDPATSPQELSPEAAALEWSSLPLEIRTREAAYDEFMRGNELPLLELLKRQEESENESVIAESADGAVDEHGEEEIRRERSPRGHGHRRLHQSVRVDQGTSQRV